MLKISRTEQFTIYYWTGSNWSTRATDAKQFSHESEARSEMDGEKITYNFNVTPVSRPGTPPNTSLVLSADELAFIKQHYGGDKSRAVHDSLKMLMNQAPSV